MKYEKLVANIFARNSNSNTQVAIGLIAGLAVGAVLGILFAPESGADVRKGISNKASGLGSDARNLYSSLKDRVTGANGTEDVVEEENQQPTQHAAKKPKSDIKELIHEAHVNGIHTEPSLN